MPRSILSFIAIALALAGSSHPALAGEQAWVRESNRNADVLLRLMKKYSPEQAGWLGVEGADEHIVDLNPDVDSRTRKDYLRAVAELKSRREKTANPLVRQDLEILIRAGENNLRTNEVECRHMLPYYNVPRIVFTGFRALLDAQVPKERQAAALTRLNRYTSMAAGTKPLTTPARERTAERIANRDLVGPDAAEVE